MAAVVALLVNPASAAARPSIDCAPLNPRFLDSYGCRVSSVNWAYYQAYPTPKDELHRIGQLRYGAIPDIGSTWSNRHGRRWNMGRVSNGPRRYMRVRIDSIGNNNNGAWNYHGAYNPDVANYYLPPSQ